MFAIVVHSPFTYDELVRLFRLFGFVESHKGRTSGTRVEFVNQNEGETLSGLRHDFEEAVDAYLESCKERGVIPRRPFSGRLVLRMSSELHGRVAFAAAGLGTTINEFINRALVDELDCLGLNLKSSATTKL